MRDQAQCYSMKKKVRSRKLQRSDGSRYHHHRWVNERAMVQKGEDDRHVRSSSVDLSKPPLTGGW